jgi:hypothetical protein
MDVSHYTALKLGRRSETGREESNAWIWWVKRKKNSTPKFRALQPSCWPEKWELTKLVAATLFILFYLLCLYLSNVFIVETEDPHLFLKGMQVAAARAFSALCFIAYKAQPQLMENASFTSDVSEVSILSHDVCWALHFFFDWNLQPFIVLDNPFFEFFLPPLCADVALLMFPSPFTIALRYGDWNQIYPAF